MPLLYWLTISAYTGAAAIGFLNCDAYQNWLEKAESEQAAIVEAASVSSGDEITDGETPEIVIITD